MNYYTDFRINYSKKTRQLQGNAIQIPIVPIQRTNANIKKTKKQFKRLPTKTSEKGLSVIY